MNTLRQIYPNINKNLKLQIQIPFVNTLLGKHPWYMSKKNVLLIPPHFIFKGGEKTTMTI